MFWKHFARQTTFSLRIHRSLTRWNEIFAEELGLSQAEYTILTDKKFMRTGICFSGSTELRQRPSDRHYNGKRMTYSAKTLSRRLGVTYKEIAELVETSFVNPHLSALTFSRLGISAEDLFRYKKQPGYDPFSPEEEGGL